jgi:hypothetical protein
MYYIKRDSTLVDGVQWYECWLAKEAEAKLMWAVLAGEIK